MNAERVAKALAVLREEGLDAKLTPEAVFIRCNRLEVEAPDRGTRTTRIIVDGKEIQNFLYGVEIKLEVGKVHEATIKLGMFP